MLNRLIQQLFNSFGVFFRTIRAFFTRKLTGVWAYLRRITNFSQQATRVATKSFQSAATAIKKPTKREDYIETQRLFISKSFLVLLAIGAVVAVLLIYFVIWPFLLSQFFTARFYCEDPDLETWSGKVIVYYDEEKKHPMYSGTLTDGVLQGRGKEYDEDGLLTYEGYFADGLYSGTGTLYEGGVAVYEGEFAAGVYEGTGSLYEDGSLVCQGAFSGGVANGMGTAYEDGSKCYEGSFADGLYDGTGTAYYPSGARSYVGGYAEGMREGDGTEYNEDGSVRYKGGFAADLYEGEGSRYLDNGDVIEAQFTAGAANGTIQWYKDGRLWYDGGAEDLTPDGFGTLYNERGKVIYTGELDQGTLDGSWLVSLTAQDLRSAFGEAALTEVDRGETFCIVNEALGLWTLCSYQQGETAPQVWEVWFQPDTDSALTDLLPWETRADFENWALMGRESTTESEYLEGSASYADGTVEGSWQLSRYLYEGYTCTGLSRAETEPPRQLHWVRTGDIPAGGTAGEDQSLSQAQERLDELLSVLDGVGGGSGGSAAASQGDVDRMLGLMLTAGDGEKLMDALVDYYVYNEMGTVLEGSRSLLEQRLDEEEILVSRGQGSQDTADALSKRLEELDRQLTQYKASAEQGKLTASNLSKLDPADYDIQAVLLSFDPVSLDASALYEAALSCATAAAAGRYEVDTAQLELDVKSALIDLNLAYESIRTARTAVEEATAALEEQTAAYAKGTADKAALYEAQCTLNQAAADLLLATGTFTHQANALNTLSGGWLAQEQDWMADTFQVLFQGEIRRGEEAAAALEEEREKEEEAAAEAIREAAAQASASPSPQVTASPSPSPEASPAPSPTAAQP